MNSACKRSKSPLLSTCVSVQQIVEGCSRHSAGFSRVCALGASAHSVKALAAAAALVAAAMPTLAGDFTVITQYGNDGVRVSANANRAVWGPFFTSGFLWERGVPGLTMLQGLPTFGQTTVSDISGDGLTVIGSTSGSSGMLPGYWRNFAAQRVNLPFNTTLYEESRSRLSSFNGNIIVGNATTRNTRSTHLMQWNLSASSVSSLVIVPSSGWTDINPRGLSGDGNVIVGDQSVVASNQITSAFVYRSNGNPQLQTLPSRVGDTQATVRGLSRDGNTAIGSSFYPTVNGNVFTGVIWNTQTRTVAAIPRLYSNRDVSPLAINGDGDVILGNSFLPLSSTTTLFVWKRSTGQMYDIHTLAASLGIDLEGWRFTNAQDISDDGKTFVGSVERGSFRGTGLLRIDCFDGPVLQPLLSSQSVCENEPISLAMSAGGSGLTYQWRKDGVNIDLASNTTAGNATLVIASGLPSDSGMYDCVVRNTCGFQTSNQVTVHVRRCCDDVDFNNDGLFPDDADLLEFLTVLAGGECTTGTCNDIDFNNDGLFPDDADLLAFLTVLAGGNC